ncbi:hypothetical protein CDG76_25040 [Nostoc sp. 'Peltigera membranacea cyanobiont' 210A]|uniref:hypothetical protein n=1 Tax=Nostoc sp. 'Peltigera membranacea cyanobiont' 210A TaxID=2014529 RepID=UPI000B95AF28|nr:hypothetical protein [Nostoc sp. 'Peltigera membranacea cyanobiont' 210A]OYD91917.1 hypothetical protein CDG76_25040 [Nostoc sp. 'Peltigera membranacea cyanobiont' 210A]
MQEKYGNLQGIKSSQIKQLQLLYKQNQPKDRFISPKLAQALAALTKEIVSEQDRVLLAGVQTEDVSVQLFEYAVYRRAK